MAASDQYIPPDGGDLESSEVEKVVEEDERRKDREFRILGNG